MGKRKLVIGEDTWEYIVGTNGVGIWDPRDGKRHNVRTYSFWLTLGNVGNASVCHESELAVTPGDIRAWIETKLLGIRELPQFMMSVGHPVISHVFAHKSIPLEEVTRRVVSSDPRFHLCKDTDSAVWGSENPYPALFSPETHLMYFFRRGEFVHNAPWGSPTFGTINYFKPQTIEKGTPATCPSST